MNQRRRPLLCRRFESASAPCPHNDSGPIQELRDFIASLERPGKSNGNYEVFMHAKHFCARCTSFEHFYS
ncbi:MAG: hypothetical protein KKE17_10450 [Proteobacteria bacterium]|nr:hypothetical protein [Pseudomonadota bacterium]MBU1710411.1 hypothetical protein [Pseudomonadota bacterium]